MSHNKKEYAKFFRRPIFSSLAKGKDISDLFGSFDSYCYETLFSNNDNNEHEISLRDLFTSLYDFLRLNYRNEYVYKTALVNKIIFGKHSPKTSSSSIELPIKNSIVDVAVFNGTSTAYEIKTEYDSPKRLITQAPDYLDVFDKVYIVTHPEYASKYCALNLPRVGVMVLNKKDQLSVIKEADSNIDYIKSDSLFSVLRKEEFLAIIEDYTSTKINMPNGLVYEYCKEIFMQMPLNIANKYFISAMKKRCNDKVFLDYIYSLPA
ncbi:TPA: sce7726 family protein, partial [Escherichia coli]|nr:sce7726 family protein [Escherichia coli]